MQHQPPVGCRTKALSGYDLGQNGILFGMAPKSRQAGAFPGRHLPGQAGSCPAAARQLPGNCRHTAALMIHLSIYLSIYPSNYLLIYLSTYVSICLSIYPSIYLSIFLSNLNRI